MNLTLELQAFLTEFAMRVPLPRQRLIERSVRNLAATGIAENAVVAGQQAPDFELSDLYGQPLRLHDALRAGPVILVFFRGVWCPYCNLTLRAYQERAQEFSTLGARVIGVSPQGMDKLRRTAERNRLQFTLLSDEGCNVAAQYGLAYTVDDELAALFSKVGHPLPDYNAAKDWLLPVAATYLIDCDGRIAMSHIDADFRRRLEPEAVLRTLRARGESGSV